MIAATMTAMADRWAAEGAPRFACRLIKDAPEPHEGERAQVYRARFELTCDLGSDWSLKRLAYALNDLLADGPIMAGAVIDAAPAGPRRARFDVAIWHRGGGSESLAISPDGPAGAHNFSGREFQNFFCEKSDD